MCPDLLKFIIRFLGEIPILLINKYARIVFSAAASHQKISIGFYYLVKTEKRDMLDIKSKTEQKRRLELM